MGYKVPVSLQTQVNNTRLIYKNVKSIMRFQRGSPLAWFGAEPLPNAHGVRKSPIVYEVVYCGDENWGSESPFCPKKDSYQYPANLRKTLNIWWDSKGA